MHEKAQAPVEGHRAMGSQNTHLSCNEALPPVEVLRGKVLNQICKYEKDSNY